MAAESTARLEAFDAGLRCVVRLAGRGTMLESRAFHDFAVRTLEETPPDANADLPSLTLDLSQCQRLDSTFLGCLVDLHKRFNSAGRRFALAAPASVLENLLGASRLDRLLPLLDEAPPVTAEGKSLLPAQTDAPRELGTHVLECHLRLVEENCPGKEAFASVAERLKHELAIRR
jgi:anti-anti-sigma regulatory factor